MQKLLALLLILSVASSSYSQSASLKGTLKDTSENKNLINTSIALLRKNDSVLVKFTRADKDGNFSMTGLKEGQFILMITHPYMGDFFDAVELKPNEVTDLGKVFLIPKSKLLAEVIIKSGAPIRIKGDTTIYTADSFRVRPGANVEELLKKLPGIQVDRNGQITAMGEVVKKVLVDGEEFFGSDPGIATKNIRADEVKEVQVFDKKSDQAEFTGIDDGTRDKTINLKMKQLKGYFGKAEAAAGIKDKYNLDAMINKFKDKQKIAAYGIISNTGQTNLDWRDAQNYGGVTDNIQLTDDGGGLMIFGGSGDDYNSEGRNGIPKNWNGGLHYSNKFNNDKLSLNSGYKFAKINTTGLTTSFSKTFLPDTSWTTNSTNNNFSSVNKHAFNLTIDATLDSANSLKWIIRANNNTSKTSSSFYSESLDDLSRFINNSTRNSTNRSDKNNVSSSLLWRHKFKKPFRTLSINTDLNWIETRSNGYLYSLNKYYSSGLENRRDTIDEQNIQNNWAKTINTKAAYTEPLSKDAYLELNYSVGYYNNENDRVTNVKGISGNYDNPVDSLSNSYVFNRLVNTPGMNFRVNKKKYSLSFGSSVGFSNFTQKNLTNGSKTNYDYVNYFPQISFTYKLKQSQNLRIYYNGASTAPSLDQLQPIRINTDPLNVYIGNPGLKQSFRHTMNTSYNSSNVLKERYFSVYFYMSATQNSFTQLSTIDTVGKRTYQTVNSNGVYSFNLSSYYSFKLKKPKLRLSVSPSVNRSQNIDFVKDTRTNITTRNITINNSYGVGTYVDKDVENKYGFSFGPNFRWNHTKASVSTSASADYWSLSSWGNAHVNLPYKIELSTDVDIQLRQKDPRFSQNSNYVTWNMTVTKRMLKDNALEISLMIYDILDQNKGYQRSFNSFSFSETYNTLLRRFGLLNITWNISKNGKPSGGF